MNPLLGRWISPDPLAIHAPGDADVNVYAYVTGRILKATDPLGLECNVDESCETVASTSDGGEAYADGTTTTEEESKKATSSYLASEQASERYEASEAQKVALDERIAAKTESTKKLGETAVVAAVELPGEAFDAVAEFAGYDTSLAPGESRMTEHAVLEVGWQLSAGTAGAAGGLLALSTGVGMMGGGLAVNSASAGLIVGGGFGTAYSGAAGANFAQGGAGWKLEEYANTVVPTAMTTAGFYAAGKALGPVLAEGGVVESILIQTEVVLLSSYVSLVQRMVNGQGSIKTTGDFIGLAGDGMGAAPNGVVGTLGTFVSGTKLIVDKVTAVEAENAGASE